MSNAVEITFALYHRPKVAESIEQRFFDFSQAMVAMQGPFSWRGLEIPRVPVVKKGDYNAMTSLTYPERKLHFHSDYSWRDDKYLSKDHAALDDKAFWDFNIGNRLIEYRDALHNSLPALTVASKAYRAAAFFDDYAVRFDKAYREARQSLLAVPGTNVDGRNNIFTLHPAQYWDAELCQKALGYGPDEVIKRLDGQVPLVRPLMDGVYTVFNDDPDLSFEQFCAINDRFKPILGLA